MYGTTRATTVGLGQGPDGVRGRLDAWDLGPLSLFRAAGYGTAMTRSAAAAAADDQPHLSLAVHLRGAGLSTHLGRERVLRPGDVAAIDLRAAYPSAWDGDAADLALDEALPDLVARHARAIPGEPDVARLARAVGTGPRHLARRCPGVVPRS